MAANDTDSMFSENIKKNIIFVFFCLFVNERQYR